MVVVFLSSVTEAVLKSYYDPTLNFISTLNFRPIPGLFSRLGGRLDKLMNTPLPPSDHDENYTIGGGTGSLCPESVVDLGAEPEGAPGFCSVRGQLFYWNHVALID